VRKLLTLVGDSKVILSALLPLLHEKDDLGFLKSKQDAMKKWNKLMRERSTRTDKPIKPQVIAQAVCDELHDIDVKMAPPPVSAQNPWYGLRSVKRNAIVRIILHPPKNVPREMADAATIITGIGITKDYACIQ
jgi:hypothetical protein